jgi:hypothetical protein
VIFGQNPSQKFPRLWKLAHLTRVFSTADDPMQLAKLAEVSGDQLGLLPELSFTLTVRQMHSTQIRFAFPSDFVMLCKNEQERIDKDQSQYMRYLKSNLENLKLTYQI